MLIDRMEVIDGKWYGGNSYGHYKFQDLLKTSEFEVGLKFRTVDPEGLLLWVGSARESKSVALSLVIFNGQLELSYGQEKIEDKSFVNDQNWHTVNIKFNRGSISMAVDEGPNKYVSTKLHLLNAFV